MESDDSSRVSAQAPDQRHARFTSHEKTAAVMRLLKGESVEAVSEELGITVRRIERWRNSFVEAGSAELAKRRDVPSKNSVVQDWNSIRQWMWLLVVLVAVTTILVVFMQRGS